MSIAILEIKDLTKEFKGVVAVDRVSFTMKSGEILGLLGPNGAGKTTLIQMILGLVTPTSGEIKVLGHDFNRCREHILSCVNFSSTYVSLPTSLTVYENLAIFAKLYNVLNPKKKISDLLESFEIGHLIHVLTRNLSSGQLTRLSLAKALLNDPQILFLDEPTASLDPDIADKTRRLLKDIRDRYGLALLYTSHNMKEMQEISDRIIFLYQGRILAAGSPSEILSIFDGESLEDVFLKVVRGKHTAGNPL